MIMKEDLSCPERKYKCDWYQNDAFVIVTLFIKNALKDEVQVEFADKEINMVVPIESEENYSTKFHLWKDIKPSDSLYKVFSTKIEMKLKKIDCAKWDLLELEESKKLCQEIATSSPAYPTSSLKKHDWDKLEAEVKRDEETEKPDGDAALNQLFQKIYSEGSEEVKKAMNKSFMESGGTVLSTNWKEVGMKNVDVKAPDGMEWKTWEK